MVMINFNVFIIILSIVAIIVIVNLIAVIKKNKTIEAQIKIIKRKNDLKETKIEFSKYKIKEYEKLTDILEQDWWQRYASEDFDFNVSEKNELISLQNIKQVMIETEDYEGAGKINSIINEKLNKISNNENK